jgi:tetratricopeptide (TPR) repeat protein
MGLVYENMGEYSKALEFYEKDLEITLKVLPENHPDLATNFSNIASLYYEIEEYSKALSLYERALKIV